MQSLWNQPEQHGANKDCGVGLTGTDSWHMLHFIIDVGALDPGGLGTFCIGRCVEQKDLN